MVFGGEPFGFALEDGEEFLGGLFGGSDGEALFDVVAEDGGDGVVEFAELSVLDEVLGEEVVESAEGDGVWRGRWWEEALAVLEPAFQEPAGECGEDGEGDEGGEGDESLAEEASGRCGGRFDGGGGLGGGDGALPFLGGGFGDVDGGAGEGDDDGRMAVEGEGDEDFGDVELSVPEGFEGEFEVLGEGLRGFGGNRRVASDGDGEAFLGAGGGEVKGGLEFGGGVDGDGEGLVEG